jgi:quercetin dioxygenase-like cupin family protein
MSQHAAPHTMLELGRALVVSADKSRWGEPVKPHPFTPFTKVSAKDTAGAWSMFDGVAPPGCGVPLHIHPNQDEWFWVLQGKFMFEVGDERFELTPGMSLLAPRRVPHRWKNSHASDGRMLVMVQPAGGLEEFFDRINRLPADQQQDHELINRMFSEHDMEVLGPPLSD